MKQLLIAGSYNKALAGTLITAGSDLALQVGVQINDLGQIVIDPPTSLVDAAYKAVAVGFSVWAVTNRGDTQS